MLDIILECKTTKDGHEIFRILVADKSGSIELYVWDELGKPICAGDILKLQMGYRMQLIPFRMAQQFKDGVLRLYLSKISVLRRIGRFLHADSFFRFNMVFREAPNFSKGDHKMVLPHDVKK